MASLTLDTLNNTIWLAEPTQLRLAVARVLAHRSCPTARELATERRERLDWFKSLRGHAVLSTLDARQIDEDFDADRRAAGDKAIRGVKGRVGIIPVHGPLEQRWSSELSKAGGTSTEEIGAALDAMMADKTIDSIVMHHDSPGGSSYGTSELARQVMSARSDKPIYSIADSMSASASFWISSAAKVAAITPGGDVGSVGVYALHLDQSKALEAEGVKVSLVKAGPHKAEFAPFVPLSEESRSHLQAMVDDTYGAFVSDLAEFRNKTPSEVRQDFGGGRMMGADQAKKNGLVDRVMTFREMMRKLTGQGGNDSGKQASVDVGLLRMRHEQMKRKGAMA